MSNPFLKELPYSNTVHARAKVNLILEINGRASCGYHYISSLICPCDLHDVLNIHVSNGSGNIACEVDYSPELLSHIDALKICEREMTDRAMQTMVSQNNLVLKAIRAFASTTEIDLSGVDILVNIKKSIPFGAGLGGGSSDAAAILRYLFFNTYNNLSTKDLYTCAASVGADVSALLVDSLVYVAGFGERLFEVTTIHNQNLSHQRIIPKSKSDLNDINAVIIKPPCSVPTQCAYERLNISRGYCEDTQVIRTGISSEMAIKLRNLGLEVSEKPEYTPIYLAKSKIPLTFHQQEDSSSTPSADSSFFALALSLKNAFEDVVCDSFVGVRDVRELLSSLGVKYFILAGSGSAWCVLCQSAEQANDIADVVRSRHGMSWFVSVTKLCCAHGGDLS